MTVGDLQISPGDILFGDEDGMSIYKCFCVFVYEDGVNFMCFKMFFCKFTCVLKCFVRFNDVFLICFHGGIVRVPTEIAAEVLVAAHEIRQMENGIFAGLLTPTMFVRLLIKRSAVTLRSILTD